jgi:DUF971 family protein
MNTTASPTSAVPALHVDKLHYHQQQKVLVVSFADGGRASFTAEQLRVFSPSAEVRGHGKPVLVRNKQAVAIKALHLTGHYAVRIVFDDGHQTGIYSWRYLAELAATLSERWLQYQQQLADANARREPELAIKVL